MLYPYELLLVHRHWGTDLPSIPNTNLAPNDTNSAIQLTMSEMIEP
jgi:hypothetical protein